MLPHPPRPNRPFHRDTMGNQSGAARGRSANNKQQPAAESTRELLGGGKASREGRLVFCGKARPPDSA